MTSEGYGDHLEGDEYAIVQSAIPEDLDGLEVLLWADFPQWPAEHWWQCGALERRRRRRQWELAGRPPLRAGGPMAPAIFCGGDEENGPTSVVGPSFDVSEHVSVRWKIGAGHG